MAKWLPAAVTTRSSRPSTTTSCCCTLEHNRPPHTLYFQSKGRASFCPFVKQQSHSCGTNHNSLPLLYVQATRTVTSTFKVPMTAAASDEASCQTTTILAREFTSDRSGHTTRHVKVVTS